ncbi:hypothetical protein DFP73DRAFT_568665, partial [Morchella snyderi]
MCNYSWLPRGQLLLLLLLLLLRDMDLGSVVVCGVWCVVCGWMVDGWMGNSVGPIHTCVCGM